MKTALLMSGGMDSTAIAFWKRPEVAITVDYGQLPAEAEIRASEAVCGALGIEHCVAYVNLKSLGSGDLAGSAALAIASAPEWWPFRNQALVSIAAMKGIAFGVNRLLIGCLRTDNFHADGKPEFISSMDQLLSIQEGGMRLLAPAIELSAAELVRVSAIPFELLAWSHSCHTSNFACGFCRGCQKHYETLEELGRKPY